MRLKSNMYYIDIISILLLKTELDRDIYYRTLIGKD